MARHQLFQVLHRLRLVGTGDPPRHHPDVLVPAPFAEIHVARVAWFQGKIRVYSVIRLREIRRGCEVVRLRHRSG